MSFWELRDVARSDVAVRDGSGRGISYGELAALCRPLADELRRETKQLAFVFCDNSPGSLIAYLSLLEAGHAVFMSDVRTNPEFQRRLVDRYRPEIIWTAGEGADSFPDHRPAVIGSQVFSFRDGDSTTPDRDLALLLSTSGSTGSPKLVRLSYRNLQANAESIAGYLGITGRERAITTLPLAYSFGLSIVHSHLLAGASVTCTNEPVISRGFWDLMRSCECTSLSGVPFTFQVLKRLRIDQMELPHLRTMTQAGGALSIDLQKRFGEMALARGMRFFVMYGQTEATARISYVPPEKLLSKLGSIGVAIPGGRLALRTGRIDALRDGEGELIYSGPNVMMGYAESREDLARGDDLGGVLATGDAARQDDDGYFYITGRLKRFLKIHGIRTNLDEVETTLHAELGRPVACVGRDDLLLVAIETADTSVARRAEAQVASLYGFHHSAVRSICVEGLPRNDAGKIRYDDLIRELGE